MTGFMNIRKQLRYDGAAAILTFLAGLCAGPSLQAADPALKITAPADGTIVNSGTNVKIEVEAEPAGAFRAVGVLGESPLGDTEGLDAPPYRFTMETPPKIDSGVYKLTALGVTQSGAQVYSRPVTIDIEQADDPKQLLAELSSISFSKVGEQSVLRITGVYEDGTLVGISRSTRTKYSSSNPSVVIVEGYVAKAVDPGFADITVKHGHLKLIIPVGVPPAKQQ
jgi:hypothetical protein